jgi:hypothetical protein
MRRSLETMALPCPAQKPFAGWKMAIAGSSIANTQPLRRQGSPRHGTRHDTPDCKMIWPFLRCRRISPDTFRALVRASVVMLYLFSTFGCSRHASGQSAAPRLRADLLTKTLWKARSGGHEEVQVVFNQGANGQIRCSPGNGEKRFDFIYKIDGRGQIIKLRLNKEVGIAKLTEDCRLSFKIGTHDYLLEPEARP